MTSFDQKSRAKRRIRVVELWALGFTAEETSQIMRDENYRISPKTVYRDRHSTDAQEYVDELIRRQLLDIAEADLEQKLQYRDKLIGKLVPQRVEAFSFSQHYEKVEETIRVDDARQYLKIINELLEQEEREAGASLKDYK